MPESLADKAYDFIRRQLLTGQLEPGSRLSNRGIAKQLDISFTPVREALGRLVSEGLLESRTGVGVFVPVIDRHEIEDIYELREMLECAALDKVGGELPGSVLQEMADLIEKMAQIGAGIRREHGKADAQEWVDHFGQIDAAFHFALLRAAGNRLVLDAVAGLRRMATVVSHSFDADPYQEVARTHEEHCRILDALRRGDVAEARRAMADHIRSGRELAIEAYQRHYMKNPTTVRQ